MSLFSKIWTTLETCLVYVFIGVNVIDEEGSQFDQLRANLNRQSRFFQHQAHYHQSASQDFSYLFGMDRFMVWNILINGS